MSHTYGATISAAFMSAETAARDARHILPRMGAWTELPGWEEPIFDGETEFPVLTFEAELSRDELRQLYREWCVRSSAIDVDRTGADHRYTFGGMDWNVSGISPVLFVDLTIWTEER